MFDVVKFTLKNLYIHPKIQPTPKHLCSLRSVKVSVLKALTAADDSTKERRV